MFASKTPDYWRSENEAEKIKQKEFQEAHRQALGKVCDVIGEDIVNDHRIIKLNKVCKLYFTTMQNTNHPNANYRGESRDQVTET